MVCEDLKAHPLSLSVKISYFVHLNRKIIFLEQ